MKKYSPRAHIHTHTQMYKAVETNTYIVLSKIRTMFELFSG